MKGLKPDTASFFYFTNSLLIVKLLGDKKIGVIVMECPYCHHEMEEGTIEADGRMPIVWNAAFKKDSMGNKIKENRLMRIASDFLGAGDEVLSEARFFVNTRLTAHKCNVCHKIMIDLDNDHQIKKED